MYVCVYILCKNILESASILISERFYSVEFVLSQRIQIQLSSIVFSACIKEKV